MYINFGLFEPMEVMFEHYVGNTLAQSQVLYSPPEILQSQFLQLSEQIGNSSQPMRIRMIRLEDAWNCFEQKMMRLEYSIDFKNNAYVRMEEEKC